MKKKFTALTIIFTLFLTAFLMVGCNEEIVDHNIMVSSSNIRYGTVVGEGYYKTKTEVTLIATANENNHFVCWIKNGIIVSSDAEYVFEANKQTEGKYVAVFYGENMQHHKLTSLQLYFNSLDTNPNNYYELLNIKLAHKINFVSTDIFNETKNEIFQNQPEHFLTEVLVDNQYVYNTDNTYDFTLYITVKNPEGREQTYTNSLIIDFSNPDLANGLTLNFNDENLVMYVNFVFEALNNIE